MWALVRLASAQPVPEKLATSNTEHRNANAKCLWAPIGSLPRSVRRSSQDGDELLGFMDQASQVVGGVDQVGSVDELEPVARLAHFFQRAPYFVHEVGRAFRAPRFFVVGPAGGSAAFELSYQARGARLFGEHRQ